MQIKAPNPPYLGPPDKHSGYGNKPIRRVVIHCTVSPCEKGGARNIAAYFRSSSAGGSAQYITDPGETVQSGHDDLICWHAPPNPHSAGFELCDPMRGLGRRWKDAKHVRMLQNAAKDVAQFCLAYGVPIRRLSVADVRANKEGICGHDDVSDAFGQSTHWDPGPAFPWPFFMQLVRKEARQLRAAAEVPDPTPEEVAKERAVPTRVTRARRLLRKALSKRDGVHDRRAIRRALRDLRKVK